MNAPTAEMVANWPARLFTPINDTWDLSRPAPSELGMRYIPTGFALLDKLAIASGATFKYVNRPEMGGPACMWPTHPAGLHVSLPYPEQFQNAEAYAHAVLHELAHWTGFTTVPREHLTYAAEEIAAETTVLMLTAELGFSEWAHNAAMSYLQAWLLNAEQMHESDCVRAAILGKPYPPKAREQFDWGIEQAGRVVEWMRKVIRE